MKSLIISIFSILYLPIVYASGPSWDEIYAKDVNPAKGWKYIVIHHSASNSGNAQQFHKLHKDKGYGGLAYHFVIGNGNGAPDGNIHESFRWKEQIIGTHVDINSWYHNIFWNRYLSRR